LRSTVVFVLFPSSAIFSQKYGDDAALCNLRKAIRADEDSRLLDAIAASGLAPAGKRMRAV
jgi:hypothetical protein